jgi:hypothetical protein
MARKAISFSPISAAGWAAGAGEGAGAGDGVVASGAGSAGRGPRSVRATAGAITARSTLALSQTGQVTKPRFACSSKLLELANQLSNSWALSQIRV